MKSIIILVQICCILVFPGCTSKSSQDIEQKVLEIDECSELNGYNKDKCYYKRALNNKIKEDCYKVVDASLRDPCLEMAYYQSWPE